MPPRVVTPPRIPMVLRPMAPAMPPTTGVNGGSAPGAIKAFRGILDLRSTAGHRTGGVQDASVHEAWPPRHATDVAATGTTANAGKISEGGKPQFRATYAHGTPTPAKARLPGQPHLLPNRGQLKLRARTSPRSSKLGEKDTAADSTIAHGCTREATGHAAGAIAVSLDSSRSATRKRRLRNSVKAANNRGA